MSNEPASMPPILGRFARTARLKHIPRGQIILYEHDTPTDVYIIKSGVVKLYDVDEHGSEKILHLVSAPAVIPFSFFSGMQDSLQWFYSTVTDCELYELPFETLHTMMLDDPTLNDALIHAFSTDVHELLVRLSSLGKTTTHGKVIAVLKFLVVRHASKLRGNWWRVTFPVNHQLIADLCGITRESTALVMKELQEEKIIRHPKLTQLEINHSNLMAYHVNL